MDDARLERIERHLADLIRTVEDLSDTVARQETDLARLTRRVEMLMARDAEREADAGYATFADRRPPHW
jgi:SlyX protein